MTLIKVMAVGGINNMAIQGYGGGGGYNNFNNEFGGGFLQEMEAMLEAENYNLTGLSAATDAFQNGETIAGVPVDPGIQDLLDFDLGELMGNLFGQYDIRMDESVGADTAALRSGLGDDSIDYKSEFSADFFTDLNQYS